MRVDIKGNNPISGEDMKRVIDSLNKEFEPIGLKVKNLTCYIRFQDETGRTVEPVSNGAKIEKTFTIKAVKEVNGK